MSFLRTTSLAAFFAMALAAACSNATDRPPPSGNAGVVTPPSGGSSGTSGSSGSSGAVDSGPPADLCDGPTQQGDIIPELRLAGTPPPPLGGAITPGTYVLTEANAYGPSQLGDAGDGGEVPAGGLTGMSGRATLVVTASTIRSFGARGTSGSLPADAVSGSSYTIAGTSLQTTAVCPTAGAQKTIPFSSVGGGLALFVDATHRELYTRR